MSLLKRVLWFKIIVTLFAWVFPFLLLPQSLFAPLLGFTPQPVFPIRMLGWAYAALVVGYSYGLREAIKGHTPWGTINMGLVSNGGTAAILGWHLVFGEAAGLSGLPVILFWSSLTALVAITLGLAFSAQQLRIQSR